MSKAGVRVGSVEAFFAAADENGDKKIDLPEFLSIMAELPKADLSTISSSGQTKAKKHFTPEFELVADKAVGSPT